MAFVCNTPPPFLPEPEGPVATVLATTVATIPVVVHVVWRTAAENVSDAQIQSQIDVLNRDFRNLNSDAQTITPAVFRPLIADAMIEFRLEGITRQQTTATEFYSDGNPSVMSSKDGGTDPWGSYYLNLWVCNLGDGSGYAQFPGGPASTDGVVISFDTFGTTGSAVAPWNLGRTASHEIGHWLNLHHLWGDEGDNPGCTRSDFVSDTPTQFEPNLGRATFPHVSCNNGPNGDLFVNHMDYTDDNLSVMFTAGQVARMQTCLATTRAKVGHMNVLASLIVDDLTATLTLPNPFNADTLHVDWGDGTVTDFTTSTGTTTNPQKFTRTYATPGEYHLAVSATGYDSLDIPNMPVLGPLTVSPSEVSNVEAATTSYNLTAGTSLIDGNTLIWDDDSTVWTTFEWNFEWPVAVEWRAAFDRYPTVVPNSATHRDDGSIDVVITEFDDPNRDDSKGTLTFTIEENLTRKGVTSAYSRASGTADVVEYEQPPPPNYPPDWPVAPGEMHFRLWEQSLGFLDLSCENGFIVREYEIAYPDVREVTYEASLADGATDLTRYFGTRAVSLDLTIRPTQSVSGQGVQWSESRMKDALLRFLDPSRRPYLYYSEHGDLRCRRVLLRPASAGLSVSLPRFNQMSVGWVAPNPHIEGYYEKCTTVELDYTASTIDVDVENEGSIGAHWEVTIDGDMATPEFQIDGSPNMNVQLNYTAQRGDLVVIRSRDRSVLVNGKAIGYQYINDKSRWFTIPVGQHQFNIVHHGVTKMVGSYPDGAWAPDPTPPDVLPEAKWANDGPYNPATPPTGWALRDSLIATEVTLCFRDTWI